MNYLKRAIKKKEKKACNSKNRIVGLCHRKRITDIQEKLRLAIRTDTHSKKTISQYHYGSYKEDRKFDPLIIQP